MNATYRLQLQPGFGFAEVRALLPYFRRLGISHLYLSPITDAREGSTHGYDVVDHNRIREELGGSDGFWGLLKAARAARLSLILDFVPNHAGVGTRNARWQDVLAYGPHSPYADHFDIDWEPLKPELKRKILLPYLESPYGEALDRGEICLVHEGGRLFASYRQNRFALAPPTYADVLQPTTAPSPGTGDHAAITDLAEAYRHLLPHERGRADALRRRLAAVAPRVHIDTVLERTRGERLHAILERQYWRLSYWRTAAYEVNYRRFFDVNDLVALRVEHPDVFRDVHRLLARLLAQDGVNGVRIDHIDGLFDPHDYLERLKKLGARHIWVEKILARGETLPPGWPVDGTIGYEFLNDALGVLTWPGGEIPLDRVYRRFVGEVPAFADEVHRSKRLVMDTALAGERFRLSYSLDRISEADYHTRDFTLEALEAALTEVVAAFPRYRTYLPHDRDGAEQVIQTAVNDARRRNPSTEPTVYTFIAQVLLREGGQTLPGSLAAWTGRFQQYTAPVAAKGVEDTALYRNLRLVALNEVGGEPDRFGMPLHAFHARARFRALRYPRNLLATATHDHKRGEDTRMRLAVLAELSDAWRRTLGLLSRIARRHRTADGPSRADEFLFNQTLVALWDGAEREPLADRLVVYMHKAAREAKLHTSWLNPDAGYEGALERFVRGVVGDPRTARAIEPLARALSSYGFANGLSQLVLKVTAPGVPDFYQGSELLDVSLVDPDNRRPVDFARRIQLLDELGPLLDRPDVDALRQLIDARDQKAKLFFVVRLLRFRQAHPGPFAGGYRALEAEGAGAEHLVAYARESEGATLVVIVPRFPATLARRDGWGTTRLPLSDHLGGRAWNEILTGQPLAVGAAVDPAALPLPWAVLFSEEESRATTESCGT